MKKAGMPKSHDMHPNVTPLIDIVMCLIIFYMLVAKIGVSTGADTKNIQLPPSLMGIKLTDLGNTVTLNILPPLGGAELPRVTTLNPKTSQVIDVPCSTPTASGRWPSGSRTCAGRTPSSR